MLRVCVRRDEGKGVRKEDGFTFLYSGRSDVRQHGVSIALGVHAARAWRSGGSEWCAVSPRILWVRLRTFHKSLFVVVGYSPTDVPEHVADAESFYTDLQAVVGNAKRGEMVVVLGDFNAHIGGNIDAWDGVTGKHLFDHETSENGYRVLDFCSFNGLVVTNTIFPHREIHQRTYQNPRTRDWHMLDLVLVNKRFRSSILDTRVFRGADIDSDHALVLSRVRLKLSTVFGKSRRRGVNVDVSGASENQLKSYRALISRALDEEEKVFQAKTTDQEWVGECSKKVFTQGRGKKVVSFGAFSKNETKN